VGELFHSFPGTPASPGGVAATVLLAEAHLCVHTWPELRAATLDVYVCNIGADHSPAAHALMDCLIALFEPQRSDLHALQRSALGSDNDSAMTLAPLAP
jgi:S-adenosylmethionine decarboxylase